MVTTFDNRKIAINPDLLERVEAVPETVLTLSNGKKLLVTESMNEVVKMFIRYKQEIHRYPHVVGKNDGITER